MTLDLHQLNSGIILRSDCQQLRLRNLYVISCSQIDESISRQFQAILEREKIIVGIDEVFAVYRTAAKIQYPHTVVQNSDVNWHDVSLSPIAPSHNGQVQQAQIQEEAMTMAARATVSKPRPMDSGRRLTNGRRSAFKKTIIQICNDPVRILNLCTWRTSFN